VHEGQSGQRAGLSCRDSPIGDARGLQSLLARHRDEGVQRGAQALDTGQKMTGQLDARKAARTQTRG
jgi:hypothetical protein